MSFALNYLQFNPYLLVNLKVQIISLLVSVKLELFRLLHRFPIRLPPFTPHPKRSITAQNYQFKSQSPLQHLKLLKMVDYPFPEAPTSNFAFKHLSVKRHSSHKFIPTTFQGIIITA